MRRRTLILSLLAVAVAIGVITPAYLAFKEAERLDQRLTRFDWLLSTIASYETTMNRMPAAVKVDEHGNPLYNWRMSLIPYAEGVKDLIDMQSPWTAPSNYDFSQRTHSLYCNPHEKPPTERIKGVVSVFIGPDTPFQIKSSLRLADVPPDTILLIEAKPNAEHWMAPGDIELGTGTLTLQHPDKNFIVGFADGEIWCLNDSVPIEKLLEFATAAPKEPRDREITLGPYKISLRRARM